jgi:hypothetical protein
MSSLLSPSPHLRIPAVAFSISDSHTARHARTKQTRSGLRGAKRANRAKLALEKGIRKTALVPKRIFSDPEKGSWVNTSGFCPAPRSLRCCVVVILPPHPVTHSNSQKGVWIGNPHIMSHALST